MVRTMGMASCFHKANAQVDTRDLSRCVSRLVRAESDDQTRLSQSSNPVDYEIPLPIYNDEKPFSCGGVIKLSSIAQLFMDYEPDWENKLRNYLTEAQNRGLINEEEIDIIYPPSSTSSYADETEQTISSTNAQVDSPDEVGLSPTTCSAGAIPWDFTPEEKEEVINHIRSLGPQYQNSTVILDKSDIPEDLLDQVSFADRDEDEVRNASRQFLSNLRRHREIQNQNPQDHSKSSNSDSEI